MEKYLINHNAEQVADAIDKMVKSQPVCKIEVELSAYGVSGELLTPQEDMNAIYDAFLQGNLCYMVGMVNGSTATITSIAVNLGLVMNNNASGIAFMSFEGAGFLAVGKYDIETGMPTSDWRVFVVE